MLSDTSDSRESLAIEIPIFIAHQADSRESLEFPIRANHATKARCTSYKWEVYRLQLGAVCRLLSVFQETAHFEPRLSAGLGLFSAGLGFV